MQFDKIINSILKEEELSREDRIKALKTLKQHDDDIHITNYFTDDNQPGVDLKYKGRRFSIWWMFDEDALAAIEQVENRQGTAEQDSMVNILRDVLDALIAAPDPESNELNDIKHNNIFGFIDVGHYRDY